MHLYNWLFSSMLINAIIYNIKRYLQMNGRVVSNLDICFIPTLEDLAYHQGKLSEQFTEDVLMWTSKPSLPWFCNTAGWLCTLFCAHICWEITSCLVNLGHFWKDYLGVTEDFLRAFSDPFNPIFISPLLWQKISLNLLRKCPRKQGNCLIICFQTSHYPTK